MTPHFGGAGPFFVVTSTGKDCDPRQCVESVALQKYPYFRHRYIAADRETYGRVLEMMGSSMDLPRLECQLSEKTVVENVSNYWSTLRDSDVVVWLDGDDWLAHAYVLDRLAEIYRLPGNLAPWLTYGSFLFSQDPGFTNPHFGTRYPAGADVRRDVWRASHLKTFRAGLAKRVLPSAWRAADGGIADFCTDRAFMLPMLEMAGERYEAVSEVLSVYNYGASFGFNNRDPAKTAAEEAERVRIHSMEPYKRLEERPW